MRFAAKWDPELIIRRPANGSRTRSLRDFGDVYDALDRLPVPIFAVRRDRTISWLNGAARALVGEKEGKPFSEIVAPASLPRAEREFARKVVGGALSTEYEATVIAVDGSHVRVEASSVPVVGSSDVISVFGVASIEAERTAATRSVDDDPLTPRQAEVLQLLARGCSTDQMASELGIARETVRNHIRAVLRALGVHSRLEAVIAAHDRGLA